MVKNINTKGEEIMKILKWICFILICLDVIFDFIIQKVLKGDIHNIPSLSGFLIGIAARVFVLYGTLTCWVLS